MIRATYPSTLQDLQGHLFRLCPEVLTLDHLGEDRKLGLLGNLWREVENGTGEGALFPDSKAVCFLKIANHSPLSLPLGAFSLGHPRPSQEAGSFGFGKRKKKGGAPEPPTCAPSGLSAS